MVYNKNDGNSFRGVAFVDVKDEDSFGKALALHNEKGPGGRKVQVRPTKTTAELADIVRKRESFLVNKKKEAKEMRDEMHGEGGGGGGDGGKSSSKANKNKKRKLAREKKAAAEGGKGNGGDGKKEKKEKKEKMETGKGEKKETGKGDKKEKGDKDSEEYKLNKKQRARKAAILASKRRR